MAGNQLGAKIRRVFLHEGICKERAVREQVCINLHYIRSRQWDTAILNLHSCFAKSLFGWYISNHRSVCLIGPASSGCKHRSSLLSHMGTGGQKKNGGNERLESLLITCPLCLSLFFSTMCLPLSLPSHWPIKKNILIVWHLPNLYLWCVASQQSDVLAPQRGLRLLCTLDLLLLHAFEVQM